MVTPLARVLVALGEPVAHLVVAPSGLDVPLSGVAIVDPDDDPTDLAGSLVLVVGARGRDALRPVRTAARHGAAAVAVKEPAPAVRSAALDSGVALLAVRPDIRWDRLEQLVLAVLETGEDTEPGGLDALAQTVGRLSGGLVSIEDTASRVLAYSRTDGSSPDELRRLSILGRQGPPDYLATLRSWGVFDRLRASEEIVHLDERPDLGIRRRIAAGIHAGAHPLGTIWIQEGDEPLSERADTVLLGAVRVAAAHLVRRRSEPAPGTQLSRDVVAGLLDGRVAADLVAAAFGIGTTVPVVVVAFLTDSRDPAARMLAASELAGLVAVHAAAFRRDALVTVVDDRVYTLLPGVTARAGGGVPAPVRALCREVTSAAASRTGTRVRAGIGAVVPGPEDAPASRTDADRVLAALPPDVDVAAITDLRAQIQLDMVLSRLDDLDDPVAAALIAHDDAHGSALAESVSALLDHLGDVAAAAAALTVHPNTLRHRLRRAGTVAGLDLTDPAARLITQLHLSRVRRNRTAPS
ncbi:PucR family transcriptional regulator [Pseudonocardia sp. HH130630-07]|uniref:PucR family transcriptional regulator n=1 Tax=Pseudonocardia sp. HH130630-07 TaxID=1690815 RepID=UPI000815380D|nr:helix-turn-helix domain-containing protein [Pseudonocardia sp. HH130630-07]ANY08031.1 hypothetical protein AFB00_18975 [Pseudonocardia sp. HH130630-07]